MDPLATHHTAPGAGRPTAQPGGPPTGAETAVIRADSALTSGYTPLGLHTEHSAGDAARTDTGPRTVITARFGDAVLYLYESLHTRGVLVIDVEEAGPQPAGLRLVTGGRDTFTAGAGTQTAPRTSGTTTTAAADPPARPPAGAPIGGMDLHIAPSDLPHLLAALDVADALAGWSIHGLLPADSDRELGQLRRDALARIRAEASRG